MRRDGDKRGQKIVNECRGVEKGNRSNREESRERE